MDGQWVIEWAGMPYGPYRSIIHAAADAERRGLIRFEIKQLMGTFESEPEFEQATVIE